MLAGAKMARFDSLAEDLLPRRQYDVAVQVGLDGHGEAARVRTFAPRSDWHQQVVSEESIGPLPFSTSDVGLNREAVWSGGQVPDGVQAEYRFSVLTSDVVYALPEGLPVPAAYPAALASDLAATEVVQVDSPEIAAALTLAGADSGDIASRLTAIHTFVEGLGSRPFKGTTDALTTLRLGEASCNGKSRLFVAMARAAGIPARLVGGVILESGHKRTSHQWVEAYVAGHWVPYCPTNGYAAELPSTYLALYRGDEALFRHTSDIDFDYAFDIHTQMVPSPNARQTMGPLNLWALFDRVGLPFALLRTLLMLPAGALVVVFFRNVVGLPTFGTFLPALIAAASGATGLAWGLVGLLIVTLGVVLVRALVQRFGLLHSPSLAILLTAVVGWLLLVSLFADAVGLASLAQVALFPIAVLAIAAERLYLAWVERGPRDALRDLAGTLVVILGCYVVMNSLALQLIVLGFPEVLLVIVAADLYLGRWTGIRVSEYLRFRPAMGVVA
ncbi:MAG: transglutaminase [Deltaproteobacteria bacterium]|nr:MAG: transglutaminase [Deltaproteobacteria bacterium]